jgi:hypothetical protein
MQPQAARRESESRTACGKADRTDVTDSLRDGPPPSDNWHPSLPQEKPTLPGPSFTTTFPPGSNCRGAITCRATDSISSTRKAGTSGHSSSSKRRTTALRWRRRSAFAARGRWNYGAAPDGSRNGRLCSTRCRNRRPSDRELGPDKTGEISQPMVANPATSGLPPVTRLPRNCKNPPLPVFGTALAHGTT